MYFYISNEVINDQSSIAFKEELQNFLFKATTDIFINKEPSYNKQEILSTYHYLKEELSKPHQFNFDVISMIVSDLGANNGWLDEKTNFGQNNYLFSGLLKPEEMEENKSTGLFSGEVPRPKGRGF